MNNTRNGRFPRSRGSDTRGDATRTGLTGHDGCTATNPPSPVYITSHGNPRNRSPASTPTTIGRCLFRARLHPPLRRPVQPLEQPGSQPRQIRCCHRIPRSHPTHQLVHARSGSTDARRPPHPGPATATADYSPPRRTTPPIPISHHPPHPFRFPVNFGPYLLQHRGVRGQIR